MDERLKNILFVATHPFEAIRTKSRQVLVSIEHRVPPPTSNFEEFPNLSISEAAEKMRNSHGDRKLA